MPNQVRMYQVIFHDDGTFNVVEIISCPKCGSMIPDQSHWWGIHEAWHDSMRKAGND